MTDDLRERCLSALDDESGGLGLTREAAVDAMLAVVGPDLDAARAALARARTLAGVMLNEAYCAGHPDTARWRAEYAAIDGTSERTT
ncbi:hypothetical protein [Streptosporangium sp. CA-115845]|uniref:hypothetical protein n=1 Tax=Streptosporangium sp. CA-115845 TaxID=3240071 RepID=UPI003D923E94